MTAGTTLWPETESEDVLASAWDEAALAHGVYDVEPHTAYERDPIGWAVEQLGIPEETIRWSLSEAYDTHTWDGDEDPLARIAEALAQWQNVGAESGTGTGKSFWVAVLILWFQACFKGARVFTFAPKEDQLRLFIWKEISGLWPRFKIHFPSAELTDLCIRMRGGIDDGWGARGYAVGVRAGENVATKAAGMHGEHMLLVYEETPGIEMAVMEAGENTCTAPHNLRVAIGNPDNQFDSLHQFSTSPGVVHVRMSALDHPNVVTGNAMMIPGAVSHEAIERRRAKYGEGSPMYQSRVRGLSPREATDAIVKREWLERARKRYDERLAKGTLPNRVTAKGVDVANSDNGDKAAICDFGENALIRLDAFPCPDSNKLGSQVFDEMEAAALAQEYVGVDPVGVGAGTVNELARKKRVVRRLNAANRPVLHAEKAPDGRTYEWAPDANEFQNLEAQMWWQLREDLRLDVIDLPYHENLWKQLTSRVYFKRNGKVTLEPKEKLSERIGGSPDEADATVRANWVRPRSVKPVESVKEQDRAPKFDYKKQQFDHRRPEDELERAFSRGQSSAIRHRVPVSISRKPR
jgi:hypothetical protein